jgi:amidase
MGRMGRLITATESGAFVEAVELGPIASGPLDGLSFAVKDLIDVGGYKTGCGNPSWQATHPVAAVNAVCVEQLLNAGARCVGKTLSDELAFSLLGENHFYGTPLNPKAPDRVPGGTSSGSASAVACGLADLALGTDTGGSVRVPSSNCGIWGLRPSHGFISVAGVNPLAPTFDTVGILAGSADILARAASVLLAYEDVQREEPTTIHLLREGFSIADSGVRQVLDSLVHRLRNLFGGRLRETYLGEIADDSDGTALRAWYNSYCVLQWAEIESCLGAWVAATKPAFGPEPARNFDLVKNLDRCRVRQAVQHRENLSRRLEMFLGANDLLCIPTTPALAPLKGTIVSRGQAAAGDYYPRTLSLTSIAGIGRLPQVSLPLAESGGVPVGLSLLAARGQDAFLLGVAQRVASEVP